MEPTSPPDRKAAHVFVFGYTDAAGRSGCIRARCKADAERRISQLHPGWTLNGKQYPPSDNEEP